MSETAPFDVTILGSGPGGYVAAIRAAQLGLKTACVEKDPQPGGTCLHWGCIPTKALLHAAEVLETARHGSAFGVEVGEVRLDLAATHRYRTKVVQSNAKGVEFLLKKNGVAYFRGEGRLAGRGKVEVAGAEGRKTLDTRHVVLATGSTIRDLKGLETDGKQVIDSDHALGLERVPASLVVIGAGAVGVEFASIWRSFGAEVTVVELLPRLVPLEDDALGDELGKAFQKRGIQVHTGTAIQKLERGPKGVHLEGEREGKPLALDAELVLVAVGRKPRTESLGLENTGVKLDARGFVEVDAMMRTGEPGVYAIGDLLATQALAHVASHEGIVAVEHIAGREPHPIDYDKIPSCTYCDPEVASCGLTEQEARRRGIDVRVGRFPFSAIGKAKVLGDSRGFVKMVAAKKHDELLGVHIIGPHATELIAEASAALALEATAESLFHAVHAHPTLSEALGEAALAVHGRPIHI